MEVSSIGTSSTHWRCAPSILPSPTASQTLFPVGFVLFSSTPSYCYCVSQSSSFYSQRGIRAVTPSPSLLQRQWTGCMILSECGGSRCAQIVSSPPSSAFGAKAAILLAILHTPRLLHFKKYIKMDISTWPVGMQRLFALYLAGLICLTRSHEVVKKNSCPG